MPDPTLPTNATTPEQALSQSALFSQLAAKVREHIEKHNNVRWGWDGDCASGLLVDDLEEFLDELERENKKDG